MHLEHRQAQGATSGRRADQEPNHRPLKLPFINWFMYRGKKQEFSTGVLCIVYINNNKKVSKGQISQWVHEQCLMNLPNSKCYFCHWFIVTVCLWVWLKVQMENNFLWMLFFELQEPQSLATRLLTSSLYIFIRACWYVSVCEFKSLETQRTDIFVEGWLQREKWLKKCFRKISKNTWEEEMMAFHITRVFYCFALDWKENFNYKAFHIINTFIAIHKV